jgi:hypothetical protein
MTLEKLHSVLQAAMGWEDRHEHAFEINGMHYSLSNSEWEEVGRDLDEDRIRLHLVLGEGDLFSYEYDFGDSWIHDIEVEAVIQSVVPMKQAVCLDGAMACPPEDSGGPTRYSDLLKTIVDPADEDHDVMLGWIGGEFDPAVFHLAEANARIQRIR